MSETARRSDWTAMLILRVAGGRPRSVTLLGGRAALARVPRGFNIITAVFTRTTRPPPIAARASETDGGHHARAEIARRGI